MKKLMVILLSLILIGLVATNSISSSGRLPKDGNTRAIQSGRYFQMYDGSITGLEHLDENTLATHANWDVTNDFTDASGYAEWTWVDTDPSTLTQVNADMALAVRDNQSLLLTYDVAAPTAVAGGTVTAWISGICDSTAISIVAGTGKTQTITSGASASSADFVLNVEADGDVSAGKLRFDNLYLTSYYESPVTIANGADITLTTPTNAIEIIVDSYGTDIKIEIGSAYYTINTLTVLPCNALETIKIANDSGSTATVYFRYVMI
jgi:hypothetical protein